MKMNFELLLILLITFVTASAKNVEIKKCEPNICGPHSKCIDDQNDPIYDKLKGPYCLCEPGTIGKPPNCTLGCIKNADCSSDEYCDLNVKQCKKVCEHNHTCETPEICHEAKKLCIGRCREDDDCKSKEICNEQHQCVDGCRSDNACKDNEHCSEGFKCIDACDESHCGDNSICTGINHIQHCACVEGYIPEKGIGCKMKEQNHTFVESDEDSCHNFCGDYASCIIEDDILHCYCPKGLRVNPIVACPPPLLYLTPKPSYCECCEQAIDPDCAVPITCALDVECFEYFQDKYSYKYLNLS